MATKPRKRTAKPKKKATADRTNYRLTPKRRALFLEQLARTANVTLAAYAAGVGRRTAYDFRDKNKAFAQQWDDAVEEAVDLQIAEASRRAFHGTEKPVFFQGVECGRIREYSDGLAWKLICAHRPQMSTNVAAMRLTARKNDDGGLEIDMISVHEEFVQRMDQIASRMLGGAPDDESESS